MAGGAAGHRISLRGDAGERGWQRYSLLGQRSKQAEHNSDPSSQSRTVFRKPLRSPRSSDASDSSSDESSSRLDSHRERLQIDSCLLGRTREFIEGNFWSGLVMVAIATNTAVMALESNYPTWPYWWRFEDFFLVFFVIEVSLRLYVYKCSFFTDPEERAWNIFDFVVVGSGVVSYLLQRVLKAGEQGESVMVLLRIVRIIRILRSCRLIRHFKQLYLLVMGFLHSLQAVFWIALLFFLVVLIAGIVVTTLVGANAEEWATGPHADDGDVDTIKEHFGTLPRSMITMFQLVTLDNWGDINSLVAKRMPLMTLFFICYILATAFAMIALLTGVITEHVTAVSRESEQAEEDEKFQSYVDTLEYVFRKAESYDGESGITFEDLLRLLRDPKVAAKMDLAGADVVPSDLHDIFKAMDFSGDGRVSWDEFRHGLRDMHGLATAKEVALLRADMAVLRSLVGRLVGGADLGPRITSLEGQVRRLEGVVHSFLCTVGAAGSPI